MLLNGGLNPALHRARTIQKLLASPLGPLLAPLVTKRSFARSLHAIFVRPERIDIDAHWAALEQNGGRAVVPRLLRYMDERRRKADRWIGALVKTDVPLSFFWGLRDPVSGAHMLEWARRARPDASFTALEVGHYPQLEAPEDFTAWLIERSR
jgi:pimeloyl-ACP methyl ester carboxylesterase